MVIYMCKQCILTRDSSAELGMANLISLQLPKHIHVKLVLKQSLNTPFLTRWLLVERFTQ